MTAYRVLPVRSVTAAPSAATVCASSQRPRCKRGDAQQVVAVSAVGDVATGQGLRQQPASGAPGVRVRRPRRVDEQQPDGECAMFVRGLARKLAPRLEATVRDLVRPPLEMELDDAGPDRRRRRQRLIAREGRDDLDLVSAAKRRLAGDAHLCFGEGQQRAEAIVVPTFVGGAALEPGQGVDGEARFAGGELRLPELEHQRHLDARAFVGREMGRVRDGAVEQARPLRAGHIASGHCRPPRADTEPPASGRRRHGSDRPGPPPLRARARQTPVPAPGRRGCARRLVSSARCARARSPGRGRA